ncbi:prephenate dehydrogenase (NADP(+)) [Phytophthora pseudosyringae]|uniref:Prephenate dehydrogenase (NADP(+)) n=1 Tax=Phytophthora pseudosyringae TaxID=221518 RepID=A0A8T1VAZ3_9STRA|nr:prephenate dehydrogenase (NADP(+)) [Phytophthora pseudosyringae]
MTESSEHGIWSSRRTWASTPRWTRSSRRRRSSPSTCPRPRAGRGLTAERQYQHSVQYSYVFYVDLIGYQTDENGINALRHLREFCKFVRVLESYPAKRKLRGDAGGCLARDCAARAQARALEHRRLARHAWFQEPCPPCRRRVQGQDRCVHDGVIYGMAKQVEAEGKQVWCGRCMEAGMATMEKDKVKYSDVEGTAETAYQALLTITKPVAGAVQPEQLLEYFVTKFEMECAPENTECMTETPVSMDAKRRYIAKRLQAIARLGFAYPTLVFYEDLDLISAS